MSIPEAPLCVFQVMVPTIRDNPIHIGIVSMVVTNPKLELSVKFVVWRGTMKEIVILELLLRQ
jgi:hypothetical protein